MSDTRIGNSDFTTTIILTGSIEDSLKKAAYLILIIFYGIYFTKQFSQKRQGIQTLQLGRKKEKHLQRIEILLLLLNVSIVFLQLVSITFTWGISSKNVQVAGLIIGLLGDCIFFAAVLTMKNSWRAGIPVDEHIELISDGIYKYSRNPAFLGFDFMYVGILLMYFNIPLLILSGIAILTLHLQILEEEKYLTSKFNNSYLEYKKHTYRYLGRRK